MMAIDTNVVVRFLARDDAAQAELAAKCIAGGVFISDGVLMETFWVMRHAFGWDRARINAALRALLAIGSVAVAQSEYLLWALDQHQAGADWPDMLHLIAARGHDAFWTFDVDLWRKVGEDAPVAVHLLK